MYPEPTVGALIINKKNEVLLITGSKFKNLYVIPGGHIEIGETIEHALLREVFEETGLTITKHKLLSIQEAIYPEGYFQKKHFIYFDFVCDCEESTVKLNHEASSYLWVSPHDALALPIEKFTKALIFAYISNPENTVNITFIPK